VVSKSFTRKVLLICFRPGVYYSSSLDKHDNPAVGRMLRNNYLSTYSQQHRPYLSGPDGKDDFPYKYIVFTNLREVFIVIYFYYWQKTTWCYS